MTSTDERIRARGAALGRLSSLTAWIGLGAIAGVGVFSAVAAVTIPGKASPTQATGTSAPARTATSTSTSTAFAPRHHGDSTGVSASSGPPMAVTGSSH